MYNKPTGNNYPTSEEIESSQPLMSSSQEMYDVPPQQDMYGMNQNNQNYSNYAQTPPYMPPPQPGNQYNHPIATPVVEPVAQPVVQPVVQPMVQPVASPVIVQQPPQVQYIQQQTPVIQYVQQPVIVNQNVPLPLLNPNLKTSPGTCYCSYCKKNVVTRVVTSCSCANVCCCLISGFFYFIPFCIFQAARNKEMNCLDATHSCPYCGARLANYEAC